jgi:hypothetical protein
MDEIAPEYDVIVLGTGEHPAVGGAMMFTLADSSPGLTECILSG